MDLFSNNSTVKTPQPEPQTPTRVQPSKPTNGVLKRHAPNHQLYHHHQVVVTYKECLKNYAAATGGHSVDGCGEFLPVPTSNPSNPQSLICDVCGCHRNFHRRETEDYFSRPVVTEYQSHNRHHPTSPPPAGNSPSNSPSSPPISSSYYPSAPHMLMALSHGSGAPSGPHPNPNPNPPIPINGNNSIGRKRFRTKFTQDQKGKMLELAGRVGWKMQKRDEVVIDELCREIGVEKGVFKVWMHNNKNTVGKKESSDNSIAAISTLPPMATGNYSNGVNFSDKNKGNGDIVKEDRVLEQEKGQGQNHVLGTDDGSSPSN